MQVNNGDSDSDIRERGGRDASLLPANNDAVVHELNRIRAEALKAIDAGGFSCVAGLFPSSTCLSPCFKLVSS
jgi:hypothetical protein